MSPERAPLVSISPEDVIAKLDLAQLGFDAAQSAARAGEAQRVFAVLLDHYRAKYAWSGQQKPALDSIIEKANDAVHHTFQWGPYEKVSYGKEVRWDWDPAGDIEWVAAVYRFFWADWLGQAYAATGDERYPCAFVELTTDWIAKHPLEERNQPHYVYANWVDYPWLDIQTGIRARSICQAFPALVHGEAFTPAFLGLLLASLYDHQVKSVHYPTDDWHNKALMELRGVMEICATFPEFRETNAWAHTAFERASAKLAGQVTEEGVQREWCGGYHAGVLGDSLAILDIEERLEVDAPEEYRNRLRLMSEYIMKLVSPLLTYPIFGDTGMRDSNPRQPRNEWQLFGLLTQLGERWEDPRFAAVARGEGPDLPAVASFAFPKSGAYTLRSGWTLDDVYLAVHNPPAQEKTVWHDSPDNGTFELYAYGRGLLTDSGFYTYSHDPAGRAWHRQTWVHQTLTLDAKDSRVDGKHLLWHDGEDGVVLAIENAAYQGLTHRRTFWFVQRRFLVLLDEAPGDARGLLDLHFQFAPGEVHFDGDNNAARSCFGEGGNVLVWAGPDAPVALEEEEGWYGPKYGHRETRKAFRLRHAAQAPACFLTVIVPYRGGGAPEVSVALDPAFQPGDAAAAVEVAVAGRAFTCVRNLAEGMAACTAK